MAEKRTGEGGALRPASSSTEVRDPMVEPRSLEPRVPESRGEMFGVPGATLPGVVEPAVALSPLATYD